MRRHIAPLGMREVEFVDDDIDVSGRTFSREGLDKIRRLVEAGRVDAVVVYDLSRLGRNAAESLRFIGWLRDRGVSVVSTREKIDDTPEGQFVLTQFAALAELYSNQVGQSWSNVIHHRARQGRLHGTPPIGYRREDGRVIHDPIIGPVVTEVFRRYAAGDPGSQLTRWLAAARGTPTRLQVLKRMLSNPVYRGKVVLWGGQHPGPSATPIYIGEGDHDPLVGEDVWQRVQERLRRESWIPNRLLTPSHALVGLVYCAHCETRMQRHESTEYGVRVVRLRCGHSLSKSGGCAGAGAAQLAQVVALVLARVAVRIEELRTDAGAAVRAAAAAARAGSDAALLKTELGRVRSEMTRLTQNWLAGRVPDSTYDTLVGPLRDAERSLEHREFAARGAVARPAPEVLAGLAEELLALWPDLSTAERNQSLGTVVRRVVVRRATRWREPIDRRVRVEWP